MKYNQREIIEIQSIISNIGLTFDFKINNLNEIIIVFLNDTSIYFKLAKIKTNEFQLEHRSSNGHCFTKSENQWDQFKRNIGIFLANVKKDNPYKSEILSNINEISKNFYKIFEEAIIIDNLGYKESSGMIFRKALEIIIKDYLTYLLPDIYKKTIQEKTIGQIIFDFYEKKDDSLSVKESKHSTIVMILEEIKDLVKIISNTFKIGNDFSHYERRLIEFSSEEMKNNIYDIVNFINTQIEKDKSLNKLTELNQKFKDEKII